MDTKTLIGKNEYLFLINDSAKELDVHCNNLNLVNDINLVRYNFNNFLLIIFPNKSLIYKDYLPENYIIKYRPALDIYKNKLKEKVIDTYEILKNEKDVYYKTDTHINMKGNYMVYKLFLNKLNKIYNLNIKGKEIKLQSKNCILTELNRGIGDLLWEKNLGNQIVNNKTDIFYFCDDIINIYYGYTITDTDYLRIINKKYEDITKTLVGSLVSWEILSDFILCKKNKTCGNKLKVVIFYDSFLLSTLSLYLELFYKVYMIKDIYNNEMIKEINPDYVFEFRVERFLF